MLCLNYLKRGRYPLGSMLQPERPKSAFRNDWCKFCSIVPNNFVLCTIEKIKLGIDLMEEKEPKCKLNSSQVQGGKKMHLNFHPMRVDLKLETIMKSGRHYWSLVPLRHQHCRRCLHRTLDVCLELAGFLPAHEVQPVAYQRPDWVQGHGYDWARRSGLSSRRLGGAPVQGRWVRKTKCAKCHERRPQVFRPLFSHLT